MGALHNLFFFGNAINYEKPVKKARGVFCVAKKKRNPRFGDPGYNGG
jgi:hypothetical protein